MRWLVVSGERIYEKRLRSKNSRPDPELTRVGPATPCGELMRRYWQPVCLSADLKDVPKRVRILVAFHDGQGRGLYPPLFRRETKRNGEGLQRVCRRDLSGPKTGVS